MKLKNLCAMALIVCMISLPVLAAKKPNMRITVGDRYVCYGLDFLQPNKALYMLSFEIPFGNLTFGPYTIPGSGYGELGCFLGYNFKITKAVDITIATVPIIFQYEGDGLKMAFVNKGTINFNVPLNPAISIYYAHLPFNTEMNGFCFDLGFSKNIIGFDLTASVNYNKGMFLESGIKGLGKMIEISKTVKLSKKLSLTGTFQRWLNNPNINENETVFLISLLHEF